MFKKEWYFINNYKPKKMAKLKVILDFCIEQIQELEEEVSNREYSFDEKSESYQESDAGQEYEYKTEALDDLKDLIFEVQEKVEKIQNKEYY